MSPIQQMLLGVGASTKATYIDDIFSTYLWAGSGSARAINNGIDLSSKGGMVWIKNRSQSSNKHVINDTVRGHSNAIMADTNDANTTQAGLLDGFNSNGFDVSTDNFVNGSSQNYASWTFRKTPGFFDIQEYSSGSSNTSGSIGNANFQVNHDLGCMPGMILIKRTDSTNDWFAWVRGKEGVLNSSSALDDASALPLADVTSTYFKFSAGNGSYNDPGNFIAYIFAGGESDAATARSVEFDGADQSLNIPDNDAWYIETNYTAECWFKIDEISGNGWDAIFGQWQSNGANATNSWILEYVGSDLRFYYLTNGATSTAYKSLGNAPFGQWHHFAFSKSGSSTRIFLNGTQVVTTFDIGTMQNGTGEFTIGGDVATDGHFKGKISNVRITKGQALYTSDFRVTTEPLTTTSQGATASNVKLLCCNNSSPTGSTVTPDTITNNNGSEASSDSPFDDPAAHVFGESGSESVIKCGSYKGNGSTGTNANDIYLGFEPQWLLIKSSSKSDTDWMLLNSMSGIPGYNGYSPYLRANTSNSEKEDDIRLQVTSTGFSPTDSEDTFNKNGETYIFCAIRRPDGYCGKPADAGTGVFAMDTGAGSSTIPNFDSGFPVDFSLNRFPASASNWVTGARLIQGKWLRANDTNAEGSFSEMTYDSNVGWNNYSSYGSNNQSWMWKRHAGFDVVTYTGNKIAGLQIPHSLNAVPEMMWVKNRGAAENWAVYHKGLNGGTNPEQYFINLNEDDAEYGSHNNMWNSTAPTSTHFTLGSWDEMNANNGNHIAMLFASVDGISKVDKYEGNGNASGPTVTLGFQPRLILIKATETTGNWIFIKVTGTGTTNNNGGYLDTNGAFFGAAYVDVTSTGFSITDNGSEVNQDGKNYIYYAHA